MLVTGQGEFRSRCGCPRVGPGRGIHCKGLQICNSFSFGIKFRPQLPSILMAVSTRSILRTLPGFPCRKSGGHYFGGYPASRFTTPPDPSVQRDSIGQQWGSNWSPFQGAGNFQQGAGQIDAIIRRAWRENRRGLGYSPVLFWRTFGARSNFKKTF